MLNTYEIVAVTIATLFLASLAMMGLWVCFGPQEPRQNRKLTNVERLVKTRSLKRVL